MIERNVLIAYAANFASFLLDSELAKKIDRIILFGSVARGDYDEKSDIDIFIDTDHKIEGSVNKMLRLFEESKINQLWRLKGVSNEISVKVGRLELWKLRRDVISTGIMLYGKYSELPTETKYYLMVRLDMRKIEVAKQMRIWRALYGYKQKIGRKIYTSKGLLGELAGKKLGKGIFLVPMERSREITAFLDKNKVSYVLDEVWSDTI